MKKVIFIIMMLLSVFCLSACGSSTPAPTNFKIENGVASWDAVNGATKYRLEFTGASTQKRVVNETSVELDSLSLPFGTYTVNVRAITDKGEGELTTDNLTYECVDDSEKISSLAGNAMTDGRFVKWTGRTEYNTQKEAMTVFHSASGLEVKFNGTDVEVVIESSKYGVTNSKYHPYVSVVLDNQYSNYNYKQHRIRLTEQETTVKLSDYFNVAEDGQTHTFTLLKSTESTDSHIYVKSVSTNGYFIEGVEYKERKIEVIAASSSTGYGNIPEGDEKTSSNSDALQAFAFLSAQDLNAEINIYSASGWGCTDSKWNPGKSVYASYKKVDFSSSNDWNFASYSPDVIVIKLGTNDWSWINEAKTPTEKERRMQQFFDDYVEFLTFLDNIYQDTTIIVFYGLMNESDMFGITNEIYNEAKKVIPDLEIIQVEGDGAGIASHPSAQSHREVANNLVAKIKAVKGW